MKLLWIAVLVVTAVVIMSEPAEGFFGNWGVSRHRTLRRRIRRSTGLTNIRRGLRRTWRRRQGLTRTRTRTRTLKRRRTNLDLITNRFKRINTRFRRTVSADVLRRRAARFSSKIKSTVRRSSRRWSRRCKYNKNKKTEKEFVEPKRVVPTTTPLSCTDVLLMTPNVTDGIFTVDPDGVGGREPISVYCEFTGGEGITIIHHDKEGEDREQRRVDGCEDPGSCSFPITYKVDWEQTKKLATSSSHCEQFVGYTAYASVLWWEENGNKQYGWWADNEGNKMTNWGGSPTGASGCACSQTAAGCKDGRRCNANANVHSETEDGGFLDDKTRLPVKALYFGDTGELNDNEYGFYKLGPLRCRGGPTTIEKEVPMFTATSSSTLKYDLPALKRDDCRVEFQIRACKKAGLAFSSTKGEQNSPVLLQFNGDKDISFKKCKSCKTESKKSVKKFLSCSKFKSMWVSWCDGCFRAGAVGDKELIAYCPNEAPSVNHVSYFSSRSGYFKFDSLYSKEITTCEGRHFDIDCGSKFVDILGANYGRRSKTVCPSAFVQTTSCRNINSFSIVGKQCQGKNKCSGPVGTGLFPDPCPGTHKYLQVKYRCLEAAQTKTFVPEICHNNECDPRGGTCLAQSSDKYVCRCRDGFSGQFCQSEFRECKGYGDPHYVGFNKELFHYQGQCRYILAQTCTRTNDKQFKVIGINLRLTGRTVSITQGLIVQIGSMEINMGQYSHVVVNGQEKTVPCDLAPDISITVDGSYLVVYSPSHEVKVYWDKRNRFRILVDHSIYKDNMCGLCGDFNPSKNGYLMRDGTRTTDVNVFGDSWTSNAFNCETCDTCIKKTEGYCAENPTLDSQVKAACDPIKNPNGIFSKAHGDFDPSGMYATCIFDLCSEREMNDVMRCNLLEEYAGRILLQKKETYIQDEEAILNWRAKLNCPYTCPQKSQYSICTTACQRTCYQRTPPDFCAMACVEGCELAPGFVFEDGVPVPESECGCLSEKTKTYYKVGKSWMNEDCSELCICHPGGNAVCNTAACVENAVCKYQNQVHGCHCEKDYIGDGLSLCQKPCPTSMGNSPRMRISVDEGNHAILDMSRPIPCEGYIRRVTVKRSETAMAPITAVVWRRSPEDEAVFLVVGSAQIPIDDDTRDLCTCDTSKIPVREGDYLGFIAATGSLLYDEVDEAKGPVMRGQFLQIVEPLKEVRFEPIQGDRAYSISYDLESCNGKTVEAFMISDYLGVGTGEIPNEDMTASSELEGFPASIGRLDNSFAGGCAWTAAVADDDQWLQIRLATPVIVIGVATQGHCGVTDDASSPRGCVSHFSVVHSTDGEDFTYVMDNEKPEVFKTKCGCETHSKNYFRTAIMPSFVRFLPITWKQSISMRVELIGRDMEEDPENAIEGMSKDPPNTVVAFVGQPLRRNAFVQGLRYHPFSRDSFILAILRPTAEANSYNLVGQMYITSSGVNQVQEYVALDSSKHIPVQPGDVYALVFREPVIGYDEDTTGDETAKVATATMDLDTFRALDVDANVKFTGEGSRRYRDVALLRRASTGRSIPPVMGTEPMGIRDGQVRDDQLSTLGFCDSNSMANRARLRSTDQQGLTGGWCAQQLDGSGYIQVDFSVERRIAGICTQGLSSSFRPWYTQRYTVNCSLDMAEWRNIADTEGNTIDFTANFDTETEVENYFPTLWKCRGVRVVPTVWEGDFPALRFEVLGLPVAPTVNTEIGFPPIISRQAVNPEGLTVAMPNKRFEGDGFVTAVRFMAKAKSSFDLTIFRPTDQGDRTYEIVGIRKIRSRKENIETLYGLRNDVTGEDDFIAVKEGDVLGATFVSSVLHMDQDAGDSTSTLTVPTAEIEGSNSLGATSVVTFTDEQRNSYSLVAVFRPKGKGEEILSVDAKDPIGLANGQFPNERITASSTHDSEVPGEDFGPGSGRLKMVSGTAGGWAPTKEDSAPWIQVETTEPSVFTGIVTQGRHSLENWWVTRCKLQWSKEGDTWEPVRDCHDQEAEYNANIDSDSEVTIFFCNPVKGRFLRVLPTAWNDRPAMRLEVLGAFGSAPKKYGAACIERTDKPKNNRILLSVGNPFESDGYITEWKLRAHQAHPIRCCVFRTDPDDQRMYIVVGCTDISGITPNVVTTYQLNGPEQIPFRKGDVFGWSFEENLITYDIGAEAVDIMSAGNKGKFDAVDVGTTWAFKYLGQEAHSIGVSVRVVTAESVPPFTCQAPLGMEANLIHSANIQSSSVLSSAYGHNQARLNTLASDDMRGCWAPATETELEYIKVVLDTQALICGLSIQGCNGEKRRVTAFRVEVKNRHNRYIPMRNKMGSEIFTGNVDNNNDKIVNVYFDRPLKSTVIKILPTEWFDGIGLRFELQGCKEKCKGSLGAEPLVRNWKKPVNDALMMIMIDKTVPCNSFITGWQFVPNNQADVTFYVLRKRGENKFKVVGKTVVDRDTARPNQETATVNLAPEDYILARAGYALAFSSKGQSPIQIQANGVDKSWVMQARLTQVAPMESLNVGKTMTIASYRNKTASFSFSALLTQQGVGQTRALIPAVSCSAPMGMESGALKDENMRASSSADVIHRGALDARPSSPTSWTASQVDDAPWIQVAFDYVAMLTGITTYGDVELESWVTSFSVEYTAVHNFLSKEPTNLAWVQFYSDLKDIFTANNNASTPKTNYFAEELEAQILRIHVESFHKKASMRFELVGCPVKKPCNPNPCQNRAPCIESQASLGYTCQCTSGKGGKNCEKDLTKCKASGDPHYTNFDQRSFDYQGKCQYVLSQTKLTSLQEHFRVSADNVPWKWGSATVTREVFVNIGDLDFDMKQNRELYLNGERLNTPFERNGISVFNTGRYLVLKTDFGLMVDWNGNNYVKIYLPDEYRGEVEGLCGNFNGNNGDDFVPRGETQSISSITTFGDSWRTGDECGPCADCQETDPCRVEDPKFPDVNKLEKATEACKTIIDDKGAFAMCHAVIDPQTAYKSCMYDFCVTYPKQDDLCKNIEVYETQCTDAMVQIGLWRIPGFCAADCPVGMVKSQSGSACPNTCGQPMAENECNAFPTPGCVCMPGMLLEGTSRCVDESECGCMHKGVYHRKGTTFVDKECSEECTCNEDHEPECTPIECHEQASCSVQEGVRGCYCNDGWTGNGTSVCEEILNPQDVIVCQDEQQELDCSATQERIEILEVEYSTAAREQCPSTLDNEGAVQTHRFARTIIKALCNEQPSCTLRPGTTTLGSFQDGAGKALRVRYQCRQVVPAPPATAEVDLVACADEPLELDCRHLKISVIGAEFRRRQGELICDRPGDAPLDTDCNSPNALFKVVERCHGKSSCTLLPNPTEMGADPCPDTSKFLLITYQCHPNPDPKMIKEDKCFPNPCVHGECSQYNEEPMYTCKCDAKFWGQHCDIPTATCKAEGDPHYIDFDGRTFDFMGNCRYTFVKNRDDQVPSFEVIAFNQASRRSRRFSSTVGASLTWNGKVYTMEQFGVLRNPEGTKVNGVTLENLRIIVDGDAIRVKTDFGLSIDWDGFYGLEVTVPENFKGHVQGLCGTYTGTPTEVYVTRLGAPADDLVKFGNSWAIPDETCETCEDCIIPEPCADEPERKLEAQNICNNIISETGPFVQCHAVVSPTKFYKDCVMDRCVMPEGIGYCEDYHSYADECKAQGIIVGWRRPDFCFIDCLAKSMVYNPAGTACPASCINPTAPATCKQPTREDCICPPDKLKENGVCVRKEDCGCVHVEGGGIYYKKDESFLTEGCGKECKCVDQNLICQIFSCPTNEMCGKVNGTTRCVCREGYYREEKLDLCVEIPVPKVFIQPLDEVEDSLLSCDKAFINILTADFGPKAATVCLGEQLGQGLKDGEVTACSQANSLAVVRHLCQGQNQCRLNAASTQAFGLPCPNLVNYISMEFSCTHEPVATAAEQATISLRTCQSRPAYLACPPHLTVAVQSAFFGRQAGDAYCLPLGDAAPEGSQSDPNALTNAETECNGKVSCSLDGARLKDPWPDTEEYLEVDYTCVPPPPAPTQ